VTHVVGQEGLRGQETAAAKELGGGAHGSGVRFGGAGRGRTRVSGVGHELTHGRHTPGACHPLRHFIERVAGNAVGKVDAGFGPLMGQIGERALNEVCSSRPALHFLLRVHSN
jgi:hypothetical protein